jgi:SAM-dependent methyltransferase
MDLVERSAGLAEEVERHPWEVARLEVLVRLLAEHAPLRSDDAVIDVGCGDGFVASCVASRFAGTRVYGIDSGLTDAMIGAFEHRHPELGVRLYRTLDDLQEAIPTPAAAVLLMDVLEHIEDDSAFLVDLGRRPFVADATRLVVTVPAYQALFSAHDVFLRHYRRYTSRSLGAVLEGAGWQVLDRDYFFTSLLPLRALQRLKERLVGAGARVGVGDAAGRVPAASLVSRALTADAALGLALRRVGIRLPGLSAFAICRTSV